MDQDLERQRKQYGKLRYLLDLHVVQRKHKQWLDDVGEVAQDLRGNAILKAIQSIREITKMDRKLSFRREMSSRVHGAIDGLLMTDAGKSRHHILTIGGKPSAHKYKTKYNNSYAVEITVGWMWRWKVWRDIYNDGKDTLPVLILAADKVRVNNKLMNVYEVLAYDLPTDLTKTGYVAVTKESRKGFYHQTASVAINRAMGEIEAAMNKYLTGKGNPHD